MMSNNQYDLSHLQSRLTYDVDDFGYGEGDNDLDDIKIIVWPPLIKA